MDNSHVNTYRALEYCGVGLICDLCDTFIPITLKSNRALSSSVPLLDFHTVLANECNVVKTLEKIYPRTFTKYNKAMSDSNIGSLLHAQYMCHTALTGGREPSELSKHAEQLLIRGADTLPGIGELRLSNFYYSRGDLLKARHLLHEYRELSVDHIEDNASYYTRLINAFDWTMFVEMSQFEMALSILNCFSNIETPETRGISCLYQNAFNQTLIDVVYTLHEIPCVGKPIVHELVSACFDTSGERKYRGCVVISNRVFVNYLRFGCCLQYSLQRSISQREQSIFPTDLDKLTVRWTLQLPSYVSEDDGDYRPIAHNVLAYCLVEIRQYSRAARHVIRSLEISPHYTNVAYHYPLTALAFCQQGGRRDRNNSRTDETKTSYLVLDGMIRKLRKQRELSKYADFVQQLMDDTCIMEMLPSRN
jgi:hypothetical protein